jgi:hypothetical protein
VLSPQQVAWLSPLSDIQQSHRRIAAGATPMEATTGDFQKTARAGPPEGEAEADPLGAGTFGSGITTRDSTDRSAVEGNKMEDLHPACDRSSSENGATAVLANARSPTEGIEAQPLTPELARLTSIWCREEPVRDLPLGTSHVGCGCV